MESYVSFTDGTILDSAASLEGSLEDVTGVAIPRGTMPTSTCTPIEEETAKEPVPPEVATKEAAPAEKPLEEPTHLLVAVDDPTEELTATQAQHKGQRKTEAPHSDYPGWMKLLHPS